MSSAKIIKYGFWFLISLFALLNIYKAAGSRKELAEPMDFRIYYLGAKLFKANENFYSDSLIHKEWQTVVEKEHTLSYSQPGYPHSVFVHLPSSVILYFPYTFFSWEKAHITSFLISLTMLALTVLILHKLQWKESLSILSIAVLLLAFKGTRFATLTGQPMLLCLPMIAGALLLLTKNKKTVAGILIGIAAFKFSFLIPLGFWLLIRKEWRTTTVSILTALTLNVFVWSQYGFSTTLFHSFTEHVNLLWNFAHSYQSLNSLNTNTTELSTLVAYFFNTNLTTLKTVAFIIYIFAYAFAAFLFIRKKINPLAFLILLYLTDFCFSHHLVYDCIILILIPLCSYSFSMRHKIIMFISILPLLLPLNQIFETLQLPSLMVITPVFIFIIYLTWLWLSIKNNNPKSEITSINNFRNQYLFNNQ